MLYDNLMLFILEYNTVFGQADPHVFRKQVFCCCLRHTTRPATFFPRSGWWGPDSSEDSKASNVGMSIQTHGLDMHPLRIVDFVFWCLWGLACVVGRCARLFVNRGNSNTRYTQCYPLVMREFALCVVLQRGVYGACRNHPRRHFAWKKQQWWR